MDQIAPDLLSWAIRSSSWHYHNVDPNTNSLSFSIVPHKEIVNSSTHSHNKLFSQKPTTQEVMFTLVSNMLQPTNHMPFPSHAATDIELPWSAQQSH